MTADLNDYCHDLSLCVDVDIRERFHYVVLMLVVILRNFSQWGDLSKCAKVLALGVFH